MRVFINALSARLGGGQTYLRYLLEGAADVDGSTIYLVAPDSLELPEGTRRLKRLRVRWPVTNPITRWAWERFRLPVILRTLRVDVLFCPGGLINTAPRDGCRTVTMFRNMVPFDRKQRRRYPIGYMRVRNWILEKAMLRSMLVADLVIFVSQYARRVIERRAGRRLPNAAVIPHGIGDDFRADYHVSKPERPKWLPEGDYFLYVSTFDFYKAQIEVIRGYALLRKLRGTPAKLVLVGSENPAYGRRMRREISRLGLEDAVVLVGFVRRADLPGAYRHALVNVFASECENCPNILLEAMAAGRPVITSNRQPMPEFGGDAVMYFDPGSPRNFAETLAALLDDASALERISLAAQERSRQYRWETSARETWRMLEKLVPKRAPKLGG